LAFKQQAIERFVRRGSTTKELSIRPSVRPSFFFFFFFLLFYYGTNAAPLAMFVG
jgi:hypothetical protein